MGEYEVWVHVPGVEGSDDLVGGGMTLFGADCKIRRFNAEAERDGCGYRYYLRPAR